MCSWTTWWSWWIRYWNEKTIKDWMVSWLFHSLSFIAYWWECMTCSQEVRGSIPFTSRDVQDFFLGLPCLCGEFVNVKNINKCASAQCDYPHVWASFLLRKLGHWIIKGQFMITRWSRYNIEILYLYKQVQNLTSLTKFFKLLLKAY